jgi:Protein of unknown function (DUF4435)
MQDNKWTIAELLARYDLEPELRDVFVEGGLDREVLSNHFRASASGHAFYEIDTVDVPDQLLARHGLTSGNKQRVIALSNELAKVPQSARVFCLVDRDLDHWFCKIENSARLRWSAFCSIEGHFLGVETIRDVLLITSRAKVANFEILVASLLNVLRQLYALRLADRELGLNLTWVALRKYLSTSSGSISFELCRYSRAVLNTSSATKKKSEFEAATDTWLEKLTCDIRLACRGHDYTELLAWAVSEFNGQREFASTGAIERLFVLLARSVSSLADEVQ